MLLTQADVGGGAAFTWSAVGIEFLIKPWDRTRCRYSALRLDTGNVPTSGSGPITAFQYSVSQYGPAFSLTFHWTEQ